MEKNQMPMNAMIIENSAGYSYGKIAFSWCRIETQMVGPRIIRPTALIKPSQPPIIAPRVVRFFQYIESSSTGKLQLAAIENARPTINAMF